MNNQITIPTTTLSLKTGSVIALTDASGQYFQVIEEGNGTFPIEIKGTSIDEWNKFTVTVNNDGSIYLSAANQNYLSVIKIDSTQNPIEANKQQPDEWCKIQLLATWNTNNQCRVVLSTQGSYWSMIDRGSEGQFIEADKTAIDEWCFFGIVILS